MKPRVASIGHLNLDIYVRVDEIPKPDSRETCREAYIAPGGAATNYAITISKLCGYSILIASCGLDVIGDFLIDRLKVLNIDIKHIKRVNETTGFVIVIVDNRGVKYMIGNSGANKYLTLTDEDLKVLENVDHVHVVLSEIEVLKEVLEKISSINVKSISLGLRTEIAKLGIDFIEKFDIRFNYMFMNFQEAYLMFKTENFEHKIRDLYDKCREFIITLGDRGSLIIIEDSKYLIQPFKVNVIDTTGAGDVYSAVYTYMRILGVEPEIAGKIASAYSALKCTKRGGSNVPEPYEVYRFLLENGCRREAEILQSQVLEK